MSSLFNIVTGNHYSAIGPTTFDSAVALPDILVAVTTHLIYLSSSADVVLYVSAVAPDIADHPVVPLSDLCHALVYVAAGDDIHVPLVVVRVSSTCSVPVTAGATVFCGTGMSTDFPAPDCTYMSTITCDSADGSSVALPLMPPIT